MKKYNFSRLIAVLLVILLAMALGLYLFSGALGSIMEEDKKAELGEAADLVVQAVRIKIKDSVTVIKSLTEEIHLFDERDINDQVKGNPF